MTDYTIITSPDCTWCSMAKTLLYSNDLEYEEFNLTEDEAIRKFFNAAGFKTVPQVFHNGRHIGGFSQLKFHLGE